MTVLSVCVDGSFDRIDSGQQPLIVILSALTEK